MSRAIVKQKSAKTHAKFLSSLTSSNFSRRKQLISDEMKVILMFAPRNLSLLVNTEIELGRSGNTNFERAHNP